MRYMAMMKRKNTPPQRISGNFILENQPQLRADNIPWVFRQNNQDALTHLVLEKSRVE